MKINFFFDLCGFIIIGILILADFFKKTCVVYLQFLELKAIILNVVKRLIN